MAQRPSALGKGLASLLPGSASPQPQGQVASSTPANIDVPGSKSVHMGSGATVAGTPSMQNMAFNQAQLGTPIQISIDQIKVNPNQPRREFNDKLIEELSQSIRVNGIIQPLIVRQHAPGQGIGYELIAGERRLRASKLAGLREVPVVIRKSTDRESLEVALIENIQRENLNCVEEAMAYLRLMEEFSLTQEEMASRVGKDRTSVANHLRLLRLPETILEDLKSGVLSLGHGKLLLGLEDQAQRLKARAEIIDKRLSVRDTEILVDRMKSEAALAAHAANHSAGTNTSSLAAAALANGQKTDHTKTRLQQIGTDLMRRFSTKVEVKGNSKRGKFLIHYHTREELERVLSLLQK